MKAFNAKKVNFLVVLLVYLGSLYYYRNLGLGFALFVSIPTTPLVLIFGGIAVEFVVKIVKTFLGWLQR